MEFLLLIAVAWVLWKLVRGYLLRSDGSHTKDDRPAIPLKAMSEYERLTSAIATERDKALRLAPGSSERAARVEEAKRHLTSLESILRKYPQISVRAGDVDTVRADLDAIASLPLFPISPKRSEIPKEGTVIVGFVDLESTGHGNEDQPISLGLVLAEIEMPKGRLVREILSLYEEREPSVPIHPRAAKIHGLTMSDLRGKRFDLAKLRDAIQQADVLVAHFAQFDRRMLGKVVMEAEGWLWRCSVRQVTWPDVLPNKKLDTICRHFSVERPTPHNALADVRALMQCLLQPSGKTERSRTYLGACLARKA